LRHSNWCYFYARKGEKIEFEIAWAQVGRNPDPGRVAVVSPQGEKMAEADAKRGAPGRISADAPQTGVYGLAIQAGSNAIEITKNSHPYGVHIAGKYGANFVTKVPLLYVALNPGQQEAIVELKTEGGAESVKGTVLAEDGKELWSGVVDGIAKVNIQRPAGAYVQFKFEKLPNCVLEDINVKAVKGVMPFAATSPVGLLKPEVK